MSSLLGQTSLLDFIPDDTEHKLSTCTQGDLLELCGLQCSLLKAQSQCLGYALQRQDKLLGPARPRVSQKMSSSSLSLQQVLFPAGRSAPPWVCAAQTAQPSRAFCCFLGEVDHGMTQSSGCEVHVRLYRLPLRKW